MAKKSFKRVAADLRKSAAIQRDKDLTEWSDDEAMIKMYTADYKDTLKVANLIEKGKIAKAMEALEWMDTAAREEAGIQLYKKSKGFYNDYMIDEGWCI